MKPCGFCGERMPDAAHLCNYCRHDQRDAPWRNEPTAQEKRNRPATLDHVTTTWPPRR